MLRVFFCLVALLPGLAVAQVYKCVGTDGRITFAQVPCPDGDGSATAHHVAPANSIQAVVPASRRSETGRPQEVGAPVVEAVENSEYQQKIEFQIKSLMSKAAKPGERDARSYETAAKLLQYAPHNRDGLIAAQDAVSAADRGRPHDAVKAARQAAAQSLAGRQYIDDLDGQRAQREARREESSGVFDPHTGKHYAPAAGGVIDPSNGKFFPRSGAGYIDPQTGRFIPGQ